ncbi:MAG TPA: PAS domain S-box protein [Paludibacter sp.]|nr:PAS domain S-box protein [Paludibacter sp.]
MHNKHIKILAIDDNRDNLVTIKALIGDIFPKAKVLTAISGKEGIDIAITESPDIILLDIVMPVMDGFEVCNKLKEDKTLADIPVIFLTANKDDKATRIHALEVGAEAFLAKPIDESELLAQIRAMLKIRMANLEKRDENIRLKAIVDERTKELKRAYSATLNLLEDLKAENEARKQTEERLRHSEEKFRDMSDLLPQVIFEMTLDQEITYVNQQAKEGFGYEIEEIIGCDLEKIFASEELERIKRNIGWKIAGTPDMNKEYKMKRKDGTIFPAMIYSNIIYKENKPVGLRGVIFDVTEQKKAQAKIIESESRYYGLYTMLRLMSDTMPDMLWVKDLDGNYTFANKSLCENLLFAADTNEPIGHSTLYFSERSNKLHPEDSDWDDFGKTCVESDKATIREMKQMQFDQFGKVHGKFVYLDVRKAPLYNENNELIGIVGTARDITEKKHAEEKLLYVTRLYALLSQINQAIVRTKTVEKLLEKVCRLAIQFGHFKMAWIGIYQEEENLLKPVVSAGFVNGYLDIISIKPNTSPEGSGPTGRAFAENKAVFCNDIANDPRMKPWKNEALKRGYKSSFAAPLYRKGTAFAVISLYATEINFFDEEEQKLLSEVCDDISHAIDAIDSETERKNTEAALVASEAKYREFIENSPEAIAIFSDGIVNYVNKECLRLLKATSKEQLLGIPVIEFIQPEHRLEVCEKVEQLSNQEEHIPMPAVEEKYVCLDGTAIDVEVKMMRMMLDGKPAMQLTARDITDRKLVEKALEDSRMELRTIYDYAPVMMCVVDSQRRIQFANKAFTALTGWNETLLKGGTVGNVIGCIQSTDTASKCGFRPRCNTCTLRLALEDTYNTGKSHQNIEFQSMMTVGNINHEVFLLGSTALIPAADQKKVLLCFHEITDRKHAEEALQKSETLLRTFIDNSPFEIWARDNESVGILENKKLVKHYGSIIGTTPYTDNRIDKITFKNWEKLNERVFAGETIDEEYEFKVGDEIRSFQQIVFPIKSNKKIIGIAGFNIDITERKMAENALSESQTKLKKFAAHLQNVREEERVLLAREIHDELGQILIAIKIDMGILKQNVMKSLNKEHSGEVLEKFDNLVTLVNNTIKTARKIITDLRPEVLELLGFSEAVKLHMKNFQERYHIECSYINTIRFLNLDSQQSVALFRIIQEALNNVAKHARATRVVVEINRQNRNLLLQISDNGIGFDENQKKNSDSYGLIGMRERVFLLDGELVIFSKPGEGTRIRITMPYSESSTP